MKDKRERGFTLIEILLVVVILGILAAIVVPRLAQARGPAMDAATRTTLAHLRDAIVRYQLDTGRYPTSEEGLNALLFPPVAGSKSWKGPYLMASSIPLDAWENPVVYRAPGTRHPTDFDLISAGPDGREGTEENIDALGAMSDPL